MTTLDYALAYAQRGWPVFPCRGKVPVTKNGWKDATTDRDRIGGWFVGGDFNVGIVCGAPGPTVLDIDKPDLAPEDVAELAAPTVATSRGRHLYFEGTDARTVTLSYGELRGRGSYVVAPPSIHPGGRQYTWTAEANGSLPTVPAFIAGARKPVGAGTAPAVEHVAPGNMYDHLKDRAIRLVRARVLDTDAVARALLAEFEAVRVPGADYNGTDGDTRRLAEWATRDSDIADRERAARSREAEPVVLPDDARTEDVAAALNAMTKAAGLDKHGLLIVGSRIVGADDDDDASADFKLSNGATVTFLSLFRDLTNLKLLGAKLTFAAGHSCRPTADDAYVLLSNLRRASEVIKAAGPDATAREIGINHLSHAGTYPIDMNDQASRWDAFVRLDCHDPERAREQGVERPDLVLVDTDGTRMVRCGWFADAARHSDPRIGSNAMVNKRMARVGWERPSKTGRIMARPPHKVERGPLVWPFYLVPRGWEES